MKAPEKIYVDSKAIGDNISTNVHTKPQDYPTCVEYIRTDAFIKKACDIFCEVCKIPNCRSNECKWISDFKGHLEII